MNDFQFILYLFEFKKMFEENEVRLENNDEEQEPQANEETKEGKENDEQEQRDDPDLMEKCIQKKFMKGVKKSGK